MRELHSLTFTFEGKCLKQDHAKALQLYVKVLWCVETDPTAEDRLGYMYEHGIGVLIDLIVVHQYYKKAVDQRTANQRADAAVAAMGDDEPVPTTAEVLAGAAADITGAVAQGRAQRAAINQQTAQVKQEQVEAQRRQQLEQQQQQVAETQRLQALAKRMEQDALDKRAREQEAARQDLTKPVWSPAEGSFDLRHPFPVDFHLITSRGGEVLVLSISIGQVTISQNSTAQGILALDVLNASTCALHLSGMLYSKGTPIKDAGDTNIGPGQRGQVDSEHGRFFANANSPVVFKPTGYLHGCQ